MQVSSSSSDRAGELTSDKTRGRRLIRSNHAGLLHCWAFWCYITLGQWVRFLYCFLYLGPPYRSLLVLIYAYSTTPCFPYL